MHYQNRLGRTAALLVVAALTGCSAMVHTPYVAPKVDVPQAWKQGATTSTEEVGDAWWRAFGDPRLDALIDAVLRSNNNLAAATLKVRRAQLQAGLARDKLVPALSASGSANTSRYLDNNAASTTRSNSASVAVSYEADLWGKLGSQRDMAIWEARATEQDRRSTALALIGTTMDLYWQAAYLNERIDVSEQSIAYAEQTLALVRVQQRAGASSDLETYEADQNLASQRASHTELLQQRVETANALAILLDGPPGVDIAAPGRLPDNPMPEVRAGLPAGLLSRRPDLRAAEMRLRESSANIDATRASYYPALSLTGSLGSVSSSLLRVMQNPVATLGAGITLPFLQWREMQLTNKVSQNQFEEAVANFRQTLYQAMSDVENGLSARTQYAAQAILLKQSYEAATSAERIYEIRYRSGAVALKLLLDAQEKSRTAALAVTQNRLDQLQTHVTLYQALGGAPPDID